MTDLLLKLSSYPLMEVFLIAAVVLVLVDYFLPVDWAAYLGYLCFALGMFWAFPFGPLGSLLTALAAWALLLILHKVWFSRFLTNAVGPRRRAGP
ncbi:MAG: hypothetical protein ACRD2Z_09970 [Thermoanaerobaculia bacterium]